MGENTCEQCDKELSLKYANSSRSLIPKKKKLMSINVKRHFSKEDSIWPKSKKKKKTHHKLLEKCKSKLQRSITSHQSEWPSLKNLQTIINAGKDVEKREPSYVAGGNVNWYNNYR